VLVVLLLMTSETLSQAVKTQEYRYFVSTIRKGVL
jgi:hypothetical protein